MKNLLSKLATSNGHGEESAYFDGWKAYDNDPFHPSTNPQGVIQMGLAENQLCFDLMEEWIMDNPGASICTSQGVDGFKDVAIFQDYHGLPRFRMAVAKFMGRARGNRVAFDPDRIVMGGGATGASETIMFCLANPGDAFLLPTPYYPAFDRDLSWRTGIKLIPVHTDSSTDFSVTRTSLESAYNKARESNINVKGLILTNPSNPLGTTIHKHTLKDLVAFANSNDLHLVCDEIYAGTVFTAPEFTSVAEIIHEDPNSVNPELIHIISSLSKDLGLPGFRVGLIYSYNDAVLSCARKMSSFGLVSSQTQHLLAAMLSDEAFVGSIMAESPIRLEKRRRVFVEGLAKMGIGSLRGNAGLFFWMDLRPLLKSPTVDAETELWRVILDEVKLNVSPGSSFHCSEPGWFRVCFANMDEDTVVVALRRIRAFVSSSKERAAVAAEEEEIEKKKKKKNSKVWRQKNNLRLSFSSRNRLYEESLGFMSSPANVMSPHSPIPHSPLVPAMT